jgi:Ca2+/Na+ antiporter
VALKLFLPKPSPERRRTTLIRTLHRRHRRIASSLKVVFGGKREGVDVVSVARLLPPRRQKRRLSARRAEAGVAALVVVVVATKRDIISLLLLLLLCCVVFLLLLVFNSQFSAESRIDEYEEYNDDFLVKRVTFFKSKKKNKKTQNAKFFSLKFLVVVDKRYLSSLLSSSLSFSFSSFFYHDRQRDRTR